MVFDKTYEEALAECKTGKSIVCEAYPTREISWSPGGHLEADDIPGSRLCFTDYEKASKFRVTY